jgi:hypothetical protein
MDRARASENLKHEPTGRTVDESAERGEYESSAGPNDELRTPIRRQEWVNTLSARRRFDWQLDDVAGIHRQFRL